MLNGLKIPGVVWVAILTAISAFLATNWPDAPWLHLITVAIGAIVKALEVQPEPPTDTERMMSPEPPPSKMARWLLGG